MTIRLPPCCEACEEPSGSCFPGPCKLYQREHPRERLRADCPLFADFAALPPAEDPEDERMRDLFREAAD
jgi:hypothetical protein